MGRTANLRLQHDAAIKLVADIHALADRLGEEGVPYQLGMLLARLTGTLRIHLAQEDKTLYPHMIASADREVSDTALAFKEEMGGLSRAFGEFAERWNSAGRIAADPQGYRAESRAILDTLVDRIARENALLYALADAIDDWQVRKTA